MLKYFPISAILRTLWLYLFFMKICKQYSYNDLFCMDGVKQKVVSVLMRDVQIEIILSVCAMWAIQSPSIGMFYNIQLSCDHKSSIGWHSGDSVSRLPPYTAHKRKVLDPDLDQIASMRSWTGCLHNVRIYPKVSARILRFLCYPHSDELCVICFSCIPGRYSIWN